MVRQFFLPSMLGALLMAWLVTLPATARRITLGYVGSVPGRWYFETHYGSPPLLRIETSGPTQESQHVDAMHVCWGATVLVLAAAYCVAMPLGWWIIGYHDGANEFIGPLQWGRRSPAATFLFVIGGCCIAGAAATGVAWALGVPYVALAPFYLIYSTPPMFWWDFSIWATIPIVPLALIVMSVRRWRHRRTFARRGFAVQLSATNHSPR